MTKKHLNAIAAAIASLPFDTASKRMAAERIAETLKTFNPLFDRERFIHACVAR